MHLPQPMRVEWGRELLRLERARREGPASWGEVAAHVHDTIVPRLARLLGKAGVDALLRRSARLVAPSFPWLADPTCAESGAGLRACLEPHDGPLALEAAALLFATLFALLDTFIGPRLTQQLVRGAWPELAAPTREETKP